MTRTIKSFIAQDKNITLLNLHTGFQRMAFKVFEVFGAVYFLEQGVSFPVVMLVFVGSYVVRFFMRPLAVRFMYAYGLKRAVIFGTVFSAGLFVFFPLIDGVNAWLVLFSLYLAVEDIVYWLPYHALYALSGESETRGKQLAVQQLFINITQIIVPLAGALVAHLAGFNALYAAALLAMLLAAVPLFYVTDMPMGEQIGLRRAMKKIDRRGFYMSTGYGIYVNAGSMLWTIVIYLAVGNLVTFGGIVTLELLIAACIGWVVGHYVDKGRSRLIAGLGGITLTIATLLQAFWQTTTVNIITINIIVALGIALFSMSYWAANYNLSKRSGSTIWFHFFSETGWDVGGIIGCLLAAALFVAGSSIQHLLLISISGLLLIFVVIRSFTKQNKLTLP